MRTLLITLGIAFVMVLPGHSQDTTSHVPMLRGHQFIGIEGIHSPFGNTRFHLNLGLGQTSKFVSKSFILPDTTIIDFNAQLYFLDLRVSYQQEIKDWISMYAIIDYTVRIGDDAESIALQGLNSIMTRETGWIFRIGERESYKLTGSFRIRNSEAIFADISGFIKDIIEGDPYASITDDIPVLVFGGGMQFAYAFNDKFGIMADGQIVYGETLERGSDSFQYFFGGIASVNFEPIIRAPITVGLGGKVNTISNVFTFDSDLLSTFNWKIAYSGNPYFNLAVEGYNGYTPIDDDLKRVKVNGMSLSLNMFF